MSEKIVNISDWFPRDSLALPSAIDAVESLRGTLEALPSAIDAVESLVNGMKSLRAMRKQQVRRQ